MEIISLHLENFRGIKEMSLDFDGDDVNIFGANGTGKTTIANAISWLIVDAPVTGEKDFTPKTVGAHNLHHMASMKIRMDDGSETTFTKDYYELWAKKRGSSAPEFSGHTTDYAQDGVPMKKKDYEAAMEIACGGSLEVVKMLIMSDYFSEVMKPEARRKVLFEVCGDISDEDVLNTPELAPLKKALIVPGTADKTYSVDDLKKIKTKARQALNKELTVIPARIDELNKQLEDVSDNGLEGECIKSAIKELMDKRADIKAMSQDTAQKKLISDIQIELNKKRSEYLCMVADKNQSATDKVTALRKELTEIDVHLANLTVKKDMKENEHDRMSRQRSALMEEYNEVKNATCNIDTTCPTCGQPLPESRLQVAKEAWIQDRTGHIKDIQRRGQACSKEKLVEIEAEIETIKAEIKAANTKANELSEQVRQANKAVEKFPAFDETDEYKELKEKLNTAKNSLANVDSEQEKEIADIDGQIEAYNERLAQFKATQGVKDRIAELEEKQRETASELENAEYIIALCESFTRAKVGMVTDNINNRFKSISFQLFRDQINGGLKECCEALIPNANGELVEYRSANTAAKINAGLEIISVLNGHYDMDVPVIIDGAESICDPREMEQQVIKLIVSADDKKIRVEEIDD